VTLVEEPSSYAKGVVAMIVLTEIFRLADIVVNWNFLTRHTPYSIFLRVDLAYVVAGALLAALSLISVKIGVGTGISYSLAGMVLTFFDPDFPHYLADPRGFLLTMDLPVSLLFTLGIVTLVIMLVLGLRGYVSLVLSQRMMAGMGDALMIRTSASLLILASGIVHLILASTEVGVGQLTLLVFGVAYLATSALILLRKYLAGMLAPLAGVLVGLMYYTLTPVNIVFVTIEFFVMGASIYLGYRSQN